MAAVLAVDRASGSHKTWTAVIESPVVGRPTREWSPGRRFPDGVRTTGLRLRLLATVPRSVVFGS
jgi:hypothetical protein